MNHLKAESNCLLIKICLFAVLTTAAKTIGVNPKINNMNQGYKAAKYDLLWICDSNIKGNLVCPNHTTVHDSAPLT